MSTNRSPNAPAVAAITRSPGDKVLTMEASRAPVPDAVRMNRSFLVMKTCFNCSVALWISLSNSGPRWLIIGLLMASTISSGMGVGPGVLRFWGVIFCIGLFVLSACHPAAWATRCDSGSRHIRRVNLIGCRQTCPSQRSGYARLTGGSSVWDLGPVVTVLDRARRTGICRVSPRLLRRDRPTAQAVDDYITVNPDRHWHIGPNI